jgi:hypothetical protein
MFSCALALLSIGRLHERLSTTDSITAFVAFLRATPHSDIPERTAFARELRASAHLGGRSASFVASSEICSGGFCSGGFCNGCDCRLTLVAWPILCVTSESLRRNPNEAGSRESSVDRRSGCDLLSRWRSHARAATAAATAAAGPSAEAAATLVAMVVDTRSVEEASVEEASVLFVVVDSTGALAPSGGGGDGGRAPAFRSPPDSASFRPAREYSMGMRLV